MKLRRRYITYDIKNGNSSDDLYDYLDEIEAEMITDSTYYVDDDLELSAFIKELKSVTSRGDRVVVIYQSKSKGICHVEVR